MSKILLFIWAVLFYLGISEALNAKWLKDGCAQDDKHKSQQTLATVNATVLLIFTSAWALWTIYKYIAKRETQNLRYRLNKEGATAPFNPLRK